jgi:hypothetical protein
VAQQCFVRYPPLGIWIVDQVEPGMCPHVQVEGGLHTGRVIINDFSLLSLILSPNEGTVDFKSQITDYLSCSK